MEITSSYAVKLQSSNGANGHLADTVAIYREAALFFINVVNAEWAAVQPVFSQNRQKAQRLIEKLTHRTKANLEPKYPFDAQFYKFPSYFRRAAIDFALGAVSSYRSNLRNWENGGKVGNPPRLPSKVDATPVFFKDNMSESNDMLTGKANTVKLKLYVNNDWVWVSINCRRQDVKYLNKYWSGVTPNAPVLIIKRTHSRKKRQFCLRYSFTETRDLSLRDALLQDRVILAVDLGINTDAVCSVMKADGTVTARKFINFPVEKDHLYHVLNRIKRQQREHGSKTGGKSEWKAAMRISDELSKKVTSAIIDTAVLYGVNTIVFEHLDTKGKIHGSKKQKLHLWRKQAIQEMVGHKAHRNLIRISRICAWGTSKYAYDGSGEVTRDASNHSLATFKSGKQYNCDLSASYNIGARYFLRELCDMDMALRERLPKTPRRVYADLRGLYTPQKVA